MKVLSLFDGMACGMLAMQKAGIQVDRYVAFEIDQYAIQTSSHNFPTIEHRGDVFHADFTEFSGFDFLVGGSPCTYWSIAQKNNRETEASGMGWELFSQYIRALHEAQPMYFIYENNKSMSAAIRSSIDKAFGFDAICINSSLVSAQNRQRLYWVGKRNPDGTYSKVHVEQPEDRGILLKDILDSATGGQAVGIGYRGRMEDGKWVKRYESNEEPKANALTNCTHDSMVAEPVSVRCRGRKDKNGNGFAKYEARSDQKANTIDTNTTNGAMVAEPVPINTTADGDKARTLMAGYYKYGTATLITNKGFTGGTTAVAEPCRVGEVGSGGLGSNTGLYAIPVEFDGDTPIKAVSCADGKKYPVFEVKDGFITIKEKQYPIKLQDGFYIIRKLIIAECKRLQTIPERFEFPVSNTQAYKMLGNGWTVDVIAHLISATQTEQSAEEQLELWSVCV